jgi:hypothetical protein
MNVLCHSGRHFPDMNSNDRHLDAPIADSGLPAELRADQRFTANMELRYSYRSADLTYIGTGRTWNLSNTAVCFEIDQEVKAGSDIEVRIAWPSRLQHVCSLELVLCGRIVRKGRDFAVLQMDSYEFQTCGDRSFSSLNSRGVTCNIAA